MAEDFTILEIETTARAVVERGGYIFQTWTCGGCRARITANAPNTLTVKGHCEECDHTTDLLVTGCNFVAVIPVDPE